MTFIADTTKVLGQNLGETRSLPMQAFEARINNMYDDIMLDLETLSTQTNGAILTIGMVKFNKDGLGDTLHLRLAEIDGHVCPETFEWWMRQDEDAQLALFYLTATPIDDALHQISKFVDQSNVWGNGATFDNAMLRQLFERRKIQCWPQWQDRCYRTWRAITGAPKHVVEGVTHNALDDACAQARNMINTGGW